MELGDYLLYSNKERNFEVSDKIGYITLLNLS